MWIENVNTCLALLNLAFFECLELLPRCRALPSALHFVESKDNFFSLCNYTVLFGEMRLRRVMNMIIKASEQRE